MTSIRDACNDSPSAEFQTSTLKRKLDKRDSNIHRIVVTELCQEGSASAFDIQVQLYEESIAPVKFLESSTKSSLPTRYTSRCCEYTPTC